MKRVTIYVDEDIWDEVKLCAWNLSSSEKRVSAGQYLIGLHIKSFNKSKEPTGEVLVKKAEESLKKELIEAQKKSEKRLESEPIKSDKAILKDILENKVFETDKLVEKAIKLKSEKKATIQGSFFNPTPKKS